MNFRDIPRQPEMSQVRLLDSDGHSDALRVILQSDGPGIVESLDRPRPVVAIHVGRSVRLECKHGGESHIGLAIHGDIDVISHGPARWEMKETDTALLLAIAPKLLKQVAEESGLKPNGLEILNRFQIRDPQIEHIGWALQAEVEQGYPSGNLYMESMAIALAVQLLHRHSSVANVRSLTIGGLSPQKLRQVLSYIEDNLRQDLALQTIAKLAGLSVSHLKVLFRRSVGIPVHQYVIRRRVDRAVLLLQQGKLSISQIALETGFAHQSHLAMHMRRILGVSPSHFNRLSA